MIGIISLLLIIYTLLFITRIAAIILEYTGLSRESARFQARSAVTGCGFTTAESEEIMNNAVRRKVVGNLMLIGNVGLVASLSSMLMSFIHVNMDNLPYEVAIRVILLGVGLLILWGLSKSRLFERLVIRIFEIAVRTPMELSTYHYGSLCHLSDGFQVSEFLVEHGMHLAGKSVSECSSLFGNVKLLGIQRSPSEYVGYPDGAVLIEENDLLILYGARNDLILMEKKVKMST